MTSRPLRLLLLPVLLALAGGARAEEEALADPPAAPPAPAVLEPYPPPQPAAPPRPAAPALPAGAEALPGGVLRLRLPAGAEAPEPPLLQAAEAYAPRLAALPAGRVTVAAQVSGPATDGSAARRLSLARGQAVKAALVRGGLDATRIDIRPLGRTADGADVVDVVPPRPQVEAPR